MKPRNPEKFEFICEVERRSTDQRFYEMLLHQVVKSVATAFISQMRKVDREDGYEGIKKILGASERGVNRE